MTSAAVSLALGGAMLYLGAEWLVGGAARLALSLRIPQLVVGLTVVAYGTSAPEVIVGVEAASEGHGAVALGNILGSNVANLGLILGVSTLVRPARVDGALRSRELPVLGLSTLALPVILADGVVSRLESIVLLLCALGYTAWMIAAARRAQITEATVETARAAEAATAAGAPPTTSRARHGVVAALGLLVLLVGGHLFVDGATTLARTWGMSERLVGLTIVAVGTSLPELATGVVAALRGSSDIAVGNVVGSNIFNVLLCLGAVGLVGRVDTSAGCFAIDTGALVGLTLLALVLLRTERIMRRWEGAVLLAAYVVFLAQLALR